MAVAVDHWVTNSLRPMACDHRARDKHFDRVATSMEAFDPTREINAEAVAVVVRPKLDRQPEA